MPSPFTRNVPSGSSQEAPTSENPPRWYTTSGATSSTVARSAAGSSRSGPPSRSTPTTMSPQVSRWREQVAAHEAGRAGHQRLHRRPPRTRLRRVAPGRPSCEPWVPELRRQARRARSSRSVEGDQLVGACGPRSSGRGSGGRRRPAAPPGRRRRAPCGGRRRASRPRPARTTRRRRRAPRAGPRPGSPPPGCPAARRLQRGEPEALVARREGEGRRAGEEGVAVVPVDPAGAHDAVPDRRAVDGGGDVLGAPSVGAGDHQAQLRVVGGDGRRRPGPAPGRSFRGSRVPSART